VYAPEDIVWHRTEPGPDFYLSGTGSVTIGEQTWPTKPGTLAKIPAHKQHSATNTGTEDLIFLVIYDPPNDDGTA